ncbi:MAG: hypothetical protein H6605_00970 [Flavobacteriales bacterium]|nr:hypothetical protein [Flavobacteriales bacterium]
MFGKYCKNIVNKGSLTLLVACIYLIITLTGCETSLEEPSDLGTDFFPLQNNITEYFTLDSVIYDGISSIPDSNRYFFKREISIMVPDSSKDFFNYRVNEFLTRDTSSGWNKAGYSFYKVENNTVNHMIGNTIYSVFTFPVLQGRKWNYNSYNSMPELMAYYKVPLVEPENNIEVIVNNDVNFIEENVHIETYRRGVGLVFSKKVELKTNGSVKRGYRVVWNRY